MCNEICENKLEKTEENLKICQICGRIFTDYKNLKQLKISMHQHFRTHDISVNDYYNRFYVDKTTQKCTNCQTNKQYPNFILEKQQDNPD